MVPEHAHGGIATYSGRRVSKWNQGSLVNARRDRKCGDEVGLDRGDLARALVRGPAPGAPSGVLEEQLVVPRLRVRELGVELPELLVGQRAGEDPEPLAGARLDEATDEERIEADGGPLEASL